MIKVSATITLKNIPDLGLKDRIKSGLRPSFNHARQLVACIIDSANNNEWIEIGVQQRVVIQLPYGDTLNWQLTAGTDFLLNIGEKIIGTGTIDNSQ